MERISSAVFKARYGTPDAAPPPAATTGPDIRLPALKQPNATEARWRAEHAHLWPLGTEFRYEEHTLRLPAGTLYTPDWTLWQGNTLLALVEVKGAHKRKDASREKFKQAVAHWPRLRFIFAQYKQAQWHTLDTQP